MFGQSSHILRSVPMFIQSSLILRSGSMFGQSSLSLRLGVHPYLRSVSEHWRTLFGRQTGSTEYSFCRQEKKYSDNCMLNELNHEA